MAANLLPITSDGGFTSGGNINSSGDSSASPSLNDFFSITSAANFAIVTDNANTDQTWTFDDLGNLTLPGNTFAVNYANGTQVSIGGGGNTGNVTFNDINIIGDGNLKLQPDSANADAYLDIFLTAGPDIHIAGNGETVILGTDDFANVAVNVDGNVSIQAGNVSGTKTWTFDPAGNLTTPSNLVIGPGAGSGSRIFQYDEGLEIVGEGANSVVLMGWTANTSAPDSVATIAMNYPSGGEGNILFAVGNNATTVNYWLFDNTGNTTFPRNIAPNTTDPILTIVGGANPTIRSDEFDLTGPANLGISALTTTFTGSSGDEIRIYPDDGEIGSTGNLQLWANAGGNTEYSWTFDTTGNLTLPLNSVVYETNIPDGALSGSAIALKPAGGTSNNQQLLIYPTAADGDHIHLTSGNLYATELFLGSDDLYVKLANTGNVVINSNDGNSNSAMWTFDTDGNLTLPGNTFAVNYANGTQVSIGGGGANTGNVTFDDNIVIGTGDEFGSAGLFLAPGNGSIANSAVQYLRVRGGDVVTHIHLDTGNNAFYDQYFGNDAKYVKLEAGDAGNVVIGTDDANGNQYSWSFTSDGNLILAGGDSVIQSIANSSLDPNNANVSTMVFTPDQNYTSQSLVIDPTGPSHIHLRAPGANIDEPDANIFLGGEDSSFEVGYYNGAAPNLFVHSGGNTWTFDTTGILVFPRDTGPNTTDPILTITGGANPKILSEDVSLAGPANLEIAALTTTFTGSSGSAIKIYPDDGEVASDGNLQIWANSGGNTEYSWTFDTTGNLTLPDTTSVLANVSITLEANDTGNITGLNVIGDSHANLYAHGNITLYANTGGAGSTWTFNNAGTLTLPQGSQISETANTSVNITANANTWAFGVNGTLTLPGSLVTPNGANAVLGFSTGTAGAPLTLTAGTGGVAATGWNSGAGGDLTITAGDAGSNIGNQSWGEVGGDLTLRSGNSTGPYVGGNVAIYSGAGPTAPGAITLNTGTNQWTFGGTGNLTLPNSATIIAPNVNDLTLRVTGEYNICTIQNAGSGYSGSTPLPTTTTGGTGSGMTVNFGYGISGQLVSVSVSDPGTGYSEGDVISVNGGSGTFVITKYNSSANQANNNTAPTDWTFGVDGNITLPNNYSSINYANGSPYGGGNVTWAQIEDKDGNSGPTIITLGQNAGFDGQGNAAIAIGKNAGQGGQGDSSITIGEDAGGNTTQGANAVAIGRSAGFDAQGEYAVAIGQNAGYAFQGLQTVAVGLNAGSNTQSNLAVAIGVSAGSNTQGDAAVAIGASAGQTSQGTYAVAIGSGAGANAQGNNSIILNATGANLNQTTANTFTVSPVRNDTSNIAEVMFYNATSKEVTYGNTISIAGNANVGNLNTTTAIITTGNITTINSGLLQNGNSNITLTANGNVSIQAAGSNVELVVTSTGANVTGTFNATGNITGSYLISAHASGNEGGEISLAQPPNGNLSGGITIDAYQNTLRMFEQGGTARGLSVDIANSPAGGGTAIGYRDIPQVAAGNVTLAATDAGKHYYSTTAGNLTLTIPLNSTVPFTTGTAISIVVQAAGNVLVNAASGVTLYMAGNSTAANRVVGGYGMATLLKVASDTWFINGAGVA